MIIAVSTMNGGLDDNISPVFGRCANFTIVEFEGDKITGNTVADNPGASATGGAGVQAAQFVAGEGCVAAIAGNFGPNAAAVLSAAEIAMVQAQGSVREVVERYLKGDSSAVEGPTVDLNYGKGGGFGRGRGGRWRG